MILFILFQSGSNLDIHFGHWTKVFFPLDKALSGFSSFCICVMPCCKYSAYFEKANCKLAEDSAWFSTTQLHVVTEFKVFEHMGSGAATCSQKA